MRHVGTLTQQFKIDINVNDLEVLILDAIQKAIESDATIRNVELDRNIEDHFLEITGRYRTGYTSHSFRATQESPAEFDIERAYIGDDTSTLLKDVPELIRNCLSVTSVEESEEMVEEY